MILAEITAAIDAAGNTRTFYLGSQSFQTSPTDTPPSENFVSAMDEPGSLGVSVYRSGRTGGYGNLEVGQIKLTNNDGRFDPWIDYGFDGRAVVLRLYQAGVPYSHMPLLFTGTVDGPPEIARDSLILRLRDKQYVLEVPVCSGTYGGTNIPPNGIDGLPGDIKGQRLCRVYGSVLNITPDLVNSSLQIFRVHDGAVADVVAVYQKGAPFTKDADYATNALLQAATITSGHYATCFAEGLFRLNTTIVGQITADVLEGATPAARTAAQVIKRIAMSAGLDADEISASDIISLDAMQSATIGIFLNDETTAREAINTVAESIGAYVVFDTTGILRMGRLSEPTGAPVLILSDSTDLDVKRISQLDGDLPNWSVTLNHTRNWTEQSSDLAGTVSVDRQSFLKKQYRQSVAEAASVKLKNLLSQPITADSLIVDPNNLALGPADQEAKRLLGLYRVRRDMMEVTVHIDVLRKSGVPSLMSVIQMDASRPGIVPGSLFWLLGFRLELKRSQATLTIWG